MVSKELNGEVYALHKVAYSGTGGTHALVTSEKKHQRNSGRSSKTRSGAQT